jgi:hypothetical protein
MHYWLAASTTVTVAGLIYMPIPPGPIVCKLRNIGTSTEQDLFTSGGFSTGTKVADAGARAFIVTFDAGGVGADPLHIATATSAGVVCDEAFAKPMDVLCTVAVFGGGLTSEGLHSFGYIMETRSGFVGQAGPRPTNIFSPTPIIVATGGQSLLWHLTATWPADAAWIHPIMNRADNPDRWYFIPDGSRQVVGGDSGLLEVLVNISDERLADSAEEADDFFSVLAQNQAGKPPIKPGDVLTYGKRMVYIVINKAYISEPNDYQNIAEDRNVVQTPGSRQIVSAFPLRSNLYLVGPAWTHTVSDNGDIPATWAAPAEVSSTIGSPAIFGVEWRTAGDYAWVASKTGLYVFNGQYPTRPISFYNSDIWDRIYWDAATFALTVKDDVLRHRVYVAAPLDGSINANYLLVWDYSRGLTPETVDFSLDNIVNTPIGNQFGGMALVPGQFGGLELWLGPAPVGGKVLREAEGSHEDSPGGIIESVYETGLLLLPGEQKQTLSRFGGVDAIIRGVGPCAVLPQGLDREVALAPINTPLETAISEPQETKFYMTESNVSIRFTCAAPQRWFELSSLKVYWKPFSY